MAFRKQFSNRPNLRDQGGTKERRFVHSPISVDHFGTQISIRENGKVRFAREAGPDPDNKEMVLIDEVEVSASAVYKAVTLLEATRQVKYLTHEESVKLGSVPAEQNEAE